jgi:hypothetical protein
MAFLLSRTDTSQFVLMDPATDTVIIDDDLAVGFAKLERTVADKPAKPKTSSSMIGGDAVPGEASVSSGGVFSFRGGSRHTPVLLAVVLPFAWLAVLYLALANLLSEHALDRSAARATESKLEALERELQALRSEIAGAPRTAKQKPKRQSGVDPTPAAGTGEPGGEAPATNPDAADVDEASKTDAGARANEKPAEVIR